MKTKFYSHGFSLLELIVVIAIIGMLTTLIVPAVHAVVDRAQSQKCLNNLRQIGMAAHLAANENDNRFPKIEINPEEPFYAPEENAKPLHEALKAYGITDKLLQCPADMKSDGPKWFTKVKSSYMWQPFAEDEPTLNITIYTGRGNFPAKPSRVRLCMDYEAVHGPESIGGRKRMNVVYADGHVNTR